MVDLKDDKSVVKLAGLLAGMSEIEMVALLAESMVEWWVDDSAEMLDEKTDN